MIKFKVPDIDNNYWHHSAAMRTAHIIIATICCYIGINRNWHWYRKILKRQLFFELQFNQWTEIVWLTQYNNIIYIISLWITISLVNINDDTRDTPNSISFWVRFNLANILHILKFNTRILRPLTSPLTHSLTNSIHKSVH